MHPVGFPSATTKPYRAADGSERASGVGASDSSEGDSGDLREHFDELVAEADWFPDSDPYIEPVWTLPGASAYLLRHALGGEVEQHLAVNGGRFIHASNGFFGEGGQEGALARERSRAFSSFSSGNRHAREPEDGVIDTAEFDALLDGSV